MSKSNMDQNTIIPIELEQLIQNRQELIEVHKKNNFTDGIHALLTDLYPDKAHFIYELLQNAEDMRATVVRFILDEKSINFEHNGTKRSFNIGDIDAITSIGKSQKKDDPTSIGKFGVGFKAVFAYTSTPIIHSGDYHFKIKDYFVPEVRDVERISTIDNDGVAWTKFSFPFNNPQKVAKDAFEECLAGLKDLDSSAILFLQNVKKIEYQVPSGDFGYVELVDNGKHHVTVTYKKPNESEKNKSRWLRFDRMIDITDDQGNTKTLPIAIAFLLKYDDKTKKYYIAPVKGGGRTFIYFPAEKEHSGLRFHINAPFASTVARDSVRDCPDNVKLIKAISKLINDSLPEIKAQSLMNHLFFEALPHRKDNLSAFYQYVLDYVCSAFQKNDYLPTKNRGYTSANSALTGPAAISDVLKEADMQALFDIKKIWIKNAAQKNSNADNFIKSLDVKAFTFNDFAQIFEPSIRVKAEKLLKARQNDWLKRFYALCADAYDSFDYSLSNAFAENMKQSLAIRSTKGEMYRSPDIYILPANVRLFTKTTPIVELSFVHPSSKADNMYGKILSFFHNKLDIQDYGPKVEIEKRLRRYKDGVDVNDQYFKDMLEFAKYKSRHDDVDFSEHLIFLYLNEGDNNICTTKASELFFGKAYRNDSGEVLASVYEKNCLWNGYSEHYDERELQQFVSFANACGIAKGLKIEECRVEQHPLYYSSLNSSARQTKYAYGSDYTIPNLEKLLKRQELQISKLIWKTLERCGKTYGSKYITAQYSPNGSATAKTCDSSLIYYLKKYAWLPNKQGKLFKPEDISISDLDKRFVYDAENKLLAALKIGDRVKKQSQEQEKLEEAARKAGLRLISEEDYKNYEQWKKLTEANGNNLSSSGHELLKKQQKQSVSNVKPSGTPEGAVNNVSRREKNIEITFRNAKQMKPTQRKLFGRVMESTQEERGLLRDWYQGKCQMCNTVIMRYDRAPHFIARNIINTQHLSSSIRQTTYLAWNSLCLCPNCAAKYTVCSRDLNGLFEQIMQTEVIEGNPERIVLSIELDGKRQEIRYIPKHFLALKKVMQLIDDETKG